MEEGANIERGQVTLQDEELKAVPEKGKEIKTDNFRKLQERISEYEEISKPPEFIDKEQVDEILNPHGLQSNDLIHPDGRLGEKLFSAIGISKDFSEFLLGMRLQVKEVIERSEAGLLNPERHEEMCSQSLERYRFIRTVEDFFDQTLSPQQKEQIASVLDSIQETKNVIEIKAANDIASLGEVLFKEDALKQAEIPLASRSLPATIQEKQEETWVDLQMLAIASSSNELQQAYHDALEPFVRKEKDLSEKLKDKDLQFRFRSTYHKHNVLFSEKDIEGNIESLSLYIAKGESLDDLKPTAEQRKALYDLVSPKLFKNLYSSIESWKGSRAAATFVELQDPRAVPGLLEHVYLYGGGHTCATVVGAIKEIVNNPLDKQELEEIIADTSDLHREIITRWFQNPNSRIKDMNDYYVAGIVKYAERHLVYDELTSLAEKIAESEGKEIKEETFQTYFLGNFNEWNETDKIDELLLEHLPKVASIVAKSKISDWRIYKQRLFNALVSPENKDFSFFPRIIAVEGLNLEPQFLAKLENLYNLKDLQRSAFARGSFAEGLLFLSSKENGKEAIMSILSAATNAREDPKRIREIFRFMQSLDNLGAFDFTPKDSLNEISLDLRNKLIEVASEKMELKEEEKEALNTKLDGLIKNGVIEIIPYLLGQFAERNDTVTNVTREIGRHIVLGDFREWRNNLETAKEQLSILPVNKQSAWLNPIEEVRIEVRAHKGKEVRRAAVDSIKRIVSETKAHMLEIYRLKFTSERLAQLERTQKQMIEQLKSKELSPEEKRELGMKKRSIDLETKIVEGILRLEFLDIEKFDPQNVIQAIEIAQDGMKGMEGLEQPIQDLDQIKKVLSAQKELATVARYRAYDSDDPADLLKSGAEPRETCQSWRGGSYNYCLPGYVADANKRVIYVKNQRGETVARSLIKLTHLKTETEERKPAILLEPVYTTAEIAPVYQAIVRLALVKAKETGASLVLKGEIELASGSDHAKTVTVLPKEAEKAGFKIDHEDVEVFVPPSHSSHIYSDTLGGGILWFGQYIPLREATVMTGG